MKKVLILNGVNLGELGTREVNIYGALSFEEYLVHLRKSFPEVDIEYAQSDDCAELVRILLAHKRDDGIVFNPGAYTHTAVVLADTIAAITVPVIEVHISNLFGREQFRRKSVIANVCSGFIAGFGLSGYHLALTALTTNNNLYNNFIK